MKRIYALLALGSWVFLLWPFPVEVFLAACLACLLHPFYQRLLQKWSRPYATICIGCGLSIGIILPITLIVLMITPQAMSALRLIDELQKSGWVGGSEMQVFFDLVDEWLRILPGMERGIRELTAEMAGLLSSVLQTIVRSGLGIAGGTMSFIVRLCILISLSMIGILYASTFLQFTHIISHVPFSVLENFIRAVRQAIRSVLWGVLFVACIQGFLCGVGLAVAGVKGAVFWGLMATTVAPLPIIGTSIIWIPASIYVWFMISKGTAVGLMLWCTIVVVGADNILRPFFLRDGLNTSFAVVLIAILCGLIAFGPVGVVAGPVLAAFALQAAREVEKNTDAE